MKMQTPYSKSKKEAFLFLSQSLSLHLAWCFSFSFFNLPSDVLPQAWGYLQGKCRPSQAPKTPPHGSARCWAENSKSCLLGGGRIGGCEVRHRGWRPCMNEGSLLMSLIKHKFKDNVVRNFQTAAEKHQAPNAWGSVWLYWLPAC